MISGVVVFAGIGVTIIFGSEARERSSRLVALRRGRRMIPPTRAMAIKRSGKTFQRTSSGLLGLGICVLNMAEVAKKGKEVYITG